MKKITAVELDLERDLEALVDSFGIESILRALAKICKTKASEPKVDWNKWALNIEHFFEEVIRIK